MQFELTSALIDDILFHMEDQHGIYVLDTHEGMVISIDDEDYDENDDVRYIGLPEWDSSDGFRLMERFTATLRNALVREELSASLNRGRGVFRAFKDILSQYPETEKLWYSFKDRGMKREVIAWYNVLREEWGMELIGEEPEDIAGLVLEDFQFRKAATADIFLAQELHRICLNDAPAAEFFYCMGEWVFPGDIGYVAQTAEGDFAGYISAAGLPDKVFRVCALEIKPEYRGLGLGNALITRLLEHSDSENIVNVIIDVPAGQEHFSRVLLREGFKPGVLRYYRTS